MLVLAGSAARITFNAAIGILEERSMFKFDKAGDFEAAYELLKSVIPRGDNVDHDADWLQQQLSDAYSLYNRDWSHARDGVIKALEAFIAFAEENTDLSFDTLKMLEPLRHLSAALRNLDGGNVDMLLRPAPRGRGARPLSLVEREFRFVVALVVLTAATKHDNACKKVADTLHKLGFKQQRLSKSSGYEDITPTTVANWVRDAVPNWAEINAATGLDLQQYLYRLALHTPPKVEGQNFPTTQSAALLRTIPCYFGHLKI